MSDSKAIIGRISLTPEETALLAAITLKQEELSPDTSPGNGELACRLMKSLVNREAIPEPRKKYFDDPTYRRGRLKGSRKELFERNGTAGEDIYHHPNFLKHLRYFLMGADLPQSAIDEFSAKAFAYGQVSGSDALMLGKLARDLTRRHSLAPHEAHDEFYKLALDCGIYQGHAARIEQIVKETR
jgi:hypothetical protein